MTTGHRLSELYLMLLLAVDNEWELFAADGMVARQRVLALLRRRGI